MIDEIYYELFDVVLSFLFNALILSFNHFLSLLLHYQLRHYFVVGIDFPTQITSLLSKEDDDIRFNLFQSRSK